MIMMILIWSDEMVSPVYGRQRCGRCGEEFDIGDRYEPSSLCLSCTIQRAMNRARVWRCPVKRDRKMRKVK